MHLLAIGYTYAINRGRHGSNEAAKPCRTISTLRPQRRKIGTINYILNSKISLFKCGITKYRSPFYPRKAATREQFNTPREDRIAHDHRFNPKT